MKHPQQHHQQQQGSESFSGVIDEVTGSIYGSFASLDSSSGDMFGLDIEPENASSITTPNFTPIKKERLLAMECQSLSNNELCDTEPQQTFSKKRVKDTAPAAVNTVSDPMDIVTTVSASSNGTSGSDSRTLSVPSEAKDTISCMSNPTISNRISTGTKSSKHDSSDESSTCSESGNENDDPVKQGNKNKATNNDAETSNCNENKPVRPLSAYNLFFQLERERIIAGISGEFTAEDVERVAIARRVLMQNVESKPKRKHRKSHGKISFAELARSIANRWKALTPHQKDLLQERAALEKQRYLHELETWTTKIEALKSQENRSATPTTITEDSSNTIPTVVSPTDAQKPKLLLELETLQASVESQRPVHIISSVTPSSAGLGPTILPSPGLALPQWQVNGGNAMPPPQTPHIVHPRYQGAPEQLEKLEESLRNQGMVRERCQCHNLEVSECPTFGKRIVRFSPNNAIMPPPLTSIKPPGAMQYRLDSQTPQSMIRPLPPGAPSLTPSSSSSCNSSTTTISSCNATASTSVMTMDEAIEMSRRTGVEPSRIMAMFHQLQQEQDIARRHSMPPPTGNSHLHQPTHNRMNSGATGVSAAFSNISIHNKSNSAGMQQSRSMQPALSQHQQQQQPSMMLRPQIVQPAPPVVFRGGNQQQQSISAMDNSIMMGPNSRRTSMTHQNQQQQIIGTLGGSVFAEPMQQQENGASSHHPTAMDEDISPVTHEEEVLMSTLLANYEDDYQRADV